MRDRRVVEGFGRQWRSFDQTKRSEEELRQTFSTYFRDFPWTMLPSEAAGIDVGCGSGRWARFVAGRVRHLVCADPSDAALGVSTRNLSGVPNCSFVAASAGELPFENESFDFGYSIGVLHYVPQPLQSLQDCVAKLKRGAPFLVYVYYALDNRGWWYRAMWRLSDAARRSISRLPFILRSSVSQLIAMTVYYPVARLSRVLEMIGVNVDQVPLAAYRKRSLYAMRTDALDRFGTALERRFTATELCELMIRSGLERVDLSPNAPYWCAVGFKSPTSADGHSRRQGIPAGLEM